MVYIINTVGLFYLQKHAIVIIQITNWLFTQWMRKLICILFENFDFNKYLLSIIYF